MNQLQIKNIIKNYFGKEDYLKIEKLEGGLTNFNYHISMKNERQYFLKVFRNADHKRVLGITNLINIILRHHFPTPELIICNDQYYWQEGQQIAIMTRYIHGKYPEKNVTNLYKIGVILGILHQIPVTKELLHGYTLNYDNQLVKIQQLEMSMRTELQNFINIVDPIIQKIPKDGFSESIIHGDVFLDNLLLTDFGDIFFIDFEGGCVDKSIFDLARAVIGCAVCNDEIDLKLAVALVTGYDATRKLSPIECDFLYEYIVYAGAVSTIWRFIEFNINRPKENKLKLYEKLMRPTIKFTNLNKGEFNSAMKVGLIL